MANQIIIENSTIDVAYVKNLQKENPHFNLSQCFQQFNEYGYRYKTTLALQAVRTNNEELFDYLIDANVNLNVDAPYDCALVLLAVKNGNLEFVKKLHQAGVDINKRRGDHCSTPLIKAVVDNNYEISKYLIDNGADLNAVTTDYFNLGHTAVLIAMSKGYYNIVELLLKHNADPCAEIDLSNLNVTRIEKILNSSPCININSIFICKACQNHPPATLAHLALIHKNKELLDKLINLNADLNINIPYLGTVLHVAAKTGDMNLVKKLYKLGANVNILSDDDCFTTPLSIAVKGGYFAIAKYLLENGANPNIPSTFGPPDALDLTFDNGHQDIMKLLLKNNTAAEIRGGLTPLMYACKIRDFNSMKMLIAYGAIYNTRGVYTAAWTRTTKELDNLLAIDVDAIDNFLTVQKSGLPILHHMLTLYRLLKNWSSTKLGKIEVLLNAGFNINCLNLDNELAVELANVPGSSDLVKRHIVKLKQAGFYLCKRNIQAVKEEFDDFHFECDQEILKLKSNKVGTSNLSFYNVLRKHFHFLTIRLMHTTKIDDIVDKNRLFNIYPIYGGIIYYKLAKIQRRIALMEYVEEFLDYVLNFCWKLPLTFTRKLYYYLTNEDLKKINFIN